MSVHLQYWWARMAKRIEAMQVKNGEALIGDKIFIRVKNGVYIIPANGSYIRFISNNWYS